ncbi:MAG: hypothetical protein NT116_02590, partial [Candidatus Parcubacteria bacterium]|nr:hypothetical protein [Candidatus Parcubacteria bacterium]
NLKKVLQKKVIECVDVLVKQKYQEIGNPYRMIRTFSITSATMDEFCPVHLSTGYEWTNNLEIAQCDAFPKDGYQEMNCLDRVRYFHY